MQKFGMISANGVSVPAAPGLYFEKSKCANDSVNRFPYREAIGSLLFAARISRPDIEYAVNYLSQFLEYNDQEHWKAVKRIFRYLKQTIDYGIIFGKSGSINELAGFTDADYAGCLQTRKSRSGYIFLLNGAPISWSSQRQNCVSLSTTEAEYVALANGTKEAIWLRRLLNELGIRCDSVKIYVDNQSAISLANNPEYHKRSKHIDVRYHFVRDVVHKREITVEYIPSDKQLADILTKPLPRETFCKLRESMNISASIK